jgi:predicted ATPase
LIKVGFQVCVSDLPSEFPPLRLLDAKQTNLPAQLTTFVGRERELDAVLALLRRDNVRLITLTGPGGTGKTRLSLQAAANVLEDYKHGVFFVPLATITDPDLVIPTIAAIFNLKELGGQPLGELLKYHLAEKHLLLVLDNLEQVLSAGPKIAELLSAAPRLRILVSSREKLHVYGEHEHPVPPLALPDMTKSPTLAVLSQCEAVVLFIQRAEAANPKFQITETAAPAVAEICVRLDGLPLAIELAAARSKLLTPQAMLDRLSSRLNALTGGARDLPPRQQTIRGAIDWSYNLLDDGEKTLFARIGVFVGGWTYESAQAVCSDGLAMEISDGLESLTDKSLIRPTEGTGGEPRFMMLETLREYAVEKLSETGELELLQDRHLAYFVALGDHAERELVGPDQVAWLDRLEVEFDNIRAALSWSFARIAKQVCDSSSPSVDFGGFAEIIATAVGGCPCCFRARCPLFCPRYAPRHSACRARWIRGWPEVSDTSLPQRAWRSFRKSGIGMERLMPSM